MPYGAFLPRPLGEGRGEGASLSFWGAATPAGAGPWHHKMATANSGLVSALCCQRMSAPLLDRTVCFPGIDNQLKPSTIYSGLSAR